MARRSIDALSLLEYSAKSCQVGYSSDGFTVRNFPENITKFPLNGRKVTAGGKHDDSVLSCSNKVSYQLLTVNI